MSEMVERVARVLCIKDGKIPDATQSYPVRVYTEGRRTDTGHDTRVSHMEDVTAYPQWRDYESKARAAIEAMRESTGKMVGAAWDRCECLEGGHDLVPPNFASIWAIMIDEALK